MDAFQQTQRFLREAGNIPLDLDFRRAPCPALAPLPGAHPRDLTTLADQTDELNKSPYQILILYLYILDLGWPGHCDIARP